MRYSEKNTYLICCRARECHILIHHQIIINNMVTPEACHLERELDGQCHLKIHPHINPPTQERIHLKTTLLLNILLIPELVVLTLLTLSVGEIQLLTHHILVTTITNSPHHTLRWAIHKQVHILIQKTIVDQLVSHHIQGLSITFNISHRLRALKNSISNHTINSLLDMKQIRNLRQLKRFVSASCPTNKILYKNHEYGFKII